MYLRPKISPPVARSPVPALLRDRTFPRAVLGRKPVAQKLLVPVDGSPASLCAVEYVITHRNGATVHLLNVQQPIMAGDVTLIASAGMTAGVRRAAGERALQSAKALLDVNDIEYTAEVAFGSPAETIVDGASARRCTKIVMGTNGRSLLSNIIRASVPSRVVRLAHVPVTLVKQSSVREAREPGRASARSENADAGSQAAQGMRLASIILERDEGRRQVMPSQPSSPAFSIGGLYKRLSQGDAARG